MENKQLEENLVKAIQNQSQGRLSLLQQDYEVHRQEIIDGYRQEATEESGVFIEQALAELKNNLIQSGSQSKWKIKKDLFIRRTELVDQLFTSIRHDLIEYTHSAAYVTDMRIKLEQALAENVIQDPILMVKEGDEAQFKELVKGKAQIVLNENIHIGGFILKDALGHLEIDETLDYALKAQREWFTSHSTLSF